MAIFLHRTTPVAFLLLLTNVPRLQAYYASAGPLLSARPGLHAVNGDKSVGSPNFDYIGLSKGKQAPYVPSGLSPEQYEKIKQAEAAKLLKMDFGAWGPRFKKSAAPDGDWMVQTGLWVRGFQSNAAAAAAKERPVTEKEMAQQETKRRQLTAARTAFSSFVLVYTVLSILGLSLERIVSANLRAKLLVSTLVKEGILQTFRLQFLTGVSLSKLQFLKLLFAGFATPLISQYREIANRRWLWSSRKILGAPILASLGVAVLKMALVTTLR